MDKPRIGIALGAGGANGLAHILMLDVLDEIGIKPHRISGSSIGSIIGALYASGMSAQQIKKLVEQFIITSEEPLMYQLINKDTMKWLDFIEIELGKGGLLSSKGLMSFLYDALKHDTFDELEIPLMVVTADLWNQEQVVFETGVLLPAIKASMALPGVFQPVTIDKRVLIDGGTVNPVPYDLLTEDCDIIIGIDVSGSRKAPDGNLPGYFETIFNSVKVMHQAIMNEKLRNITPDVYIAPKINNIKSLEFYRAEEIFEQARPAREELKDKLTEIIKQWKNKH